MEPFENENLQPEVSQEDAPAAQETPVAQETPEHTAENKPQETKQGSPYVVYQYLPQSPVPPAGNQPWDQPGAPVKPKEQQKGKVWKKLVAAVLVLAVVAAGCGISVSVASSHWQEQFRLLSKRFDERLDVLRQEMDQQNEEPGVPGGELEAPGEALTASEIYQQNVNSVLAITCKVRSTNNFGQITEYASSGTGFVLTEDGYIATNHHVIDGATKITVTCFDGTSFTAKLIGSDATNDVALLKAEVTGLDPVTIGSSSAMQVGDHVVAIGNALGELSSSLTVGYVSGMDRDVSTDGSVINMIQTDAAINSGNSGGPLFNARGEVIGITTAKYSGTTSSGASIEGISFAIPMDDVIGMLEDLKEFGYIRSAYLGVMVREMDPAITELYNLPLGVYVEEVTFGSCAEKADVRAKDIIIGLGGYEIEGMNDLSRALRAYHGGETVTITVWRSGQEVILEITLDVKPQS